MRRIPDGAFSLRSLRADRDSLDAALRELEPHMSDSLAHRELTNVRAKIQARIERTEAALDSLFRVAS